MGKPTVLEVQKALQGYQAATDPKLRTLENSVSFLESKLGAATVGSLSALEERVLACEKRGTAQAAQIQDLQEFQTKVDVTLSQFSREFEQLQSTLAGLDTAIQQVNSTADAGTAQVQAQREHVEEVRTELLSGADRLKDELLARLQETSNKLSQEFRSAGDVHQESVKDLHGLLKTHTNDCILQRSTVDQRFQSVRSEADRNKDEAKESVNELRQKIEAADAIATARLNSLQELLNGTSTTLVEQMKQELALVNNKGSSYFDQSQEAVQALGAQLRAALEEVETSVSKMRNSVASLSTHRVRWRINDFRDKLWKLLQQESSQTIQSPNFVISCVEDVFLELRVHPKQKHFPEGGHGAQKIAEGVVRPAIGVPIPGVISVVVWAPVGLKMKFRVAVGSTSKVFGHHFIEEEEIPPRPVEAMATGPRAQRCCYVATNFCTLDSVWDKVNDILDVGLEVVEAQESVKVVRPIHCKEAANFGELEEVTFVTDCHSESRILEKVKKEVAVFTNRAVRRVEWKIDNISQVLASHDCGAHLNSPCFSVGGVDRVQLQLFPNACNDNVKDGFCSMFVTFPKGTRAEVVLFIGDHRRRVEHLFSEDNEHAGKPQFCMLRDQVDEVTDSVLVGLEIVQLSTDVETVGASKGTNTSTLRLKSIDQTKLQESRSVAHPHIPKSTQSGASTRPPTASGTMRSASASSFPVVPHRRSRPSTGVGRRARSPSDFGSTMEFSQEDVVPTSLPSTRPGTPGNYGAARNRPASHHGGRGMRSADPRALQNLAAALAGRP
mmetsp:Transcript_131143/g.298559  ORF Transcript_131143/g.298559 Transcript_131143/m.298559 type:complete len:782 (+) Transcript_131143:27-2372(+)